MSPLLGRNISPYVQRIGMKISFGHWKKPFFQVLKKKTKKKRQQRHRASFHIEELERRRSETRRASFINTSNFSVSINHNNGKSHGKEEVKDDSNSSKDVSSMIQEDTLDNLGNSSNFSQDDDADENNRESSIEESSDSIEEARTTHIHVDQVLIVDERLDESK